MIPLQDLRPQHAALREELMAAVEQVVSSSRFIGGEEVDAFAAEFAAMCGVSHAVPCASGTEALRWAIIGVLGHGNGHHGEIITVSHTFVATVEAIAAAGYVPRLVDIDPRTCLMDLDRLEEARTRRTVAVVPVHLYGQMVDMPRLRAWSDGHGLAVIEDAAQAHGAKFAGYTPGQLSEAACFSFYPAKNLGAWGDAGAVVCQDETIARRINEFLDHGRREKYVHHRAGWNARMDALQAAILRVKLRRLAEWNESRRRVAGWYDELFQQDPVALPVSRHPDATPVYHQYVVETEDRDELRAALEQQGIETGIHYPVPVHRQPAWMHLVRGGPELGNTERACARILSLPIFPGLTRRKVEEVVCGLREWHGTLTAR
jgi:dTDP-4-amino-4,6-dideoxygalactose transaminase